MPRSLHSRRLVAEALDILWGLPPAGLALPASGTVRRRSAGMLSPEQADLAERVVTALAGWRAVVLAAPVGSGKTWIALHAAARHGGTLAVIGPAALRHQWVDTATRLAIRISYTSLERVSLGHLPPPDSTMVLIDEAHRLRHPGTRRVQHLRPWLIGRETIFITGTPIVNGPRDLIRLLRLCLADDCLRLDGIPSLDALALMASPPRALARLVLRGAPRSQRIPVVRRELPPSPAEDTRGQRVLATLARLALGESAAIGRLARVVLLDAAASSDTAWHLALERYRSLLRHAEQAGRLSRAAIRAFVGPCPDQGVLWQLLRTSAQPSLLPIDDLRILDEALACPPDDADWIAGVRDAIAGFGPTLLFTRHLGTLDAVRASLGSDVAWVTGGAAGIGAHRMARHTVLAAFGPERTMWRFRRAIPELLVLSDVGSEGLDLQGARCVVHLDLPWHETGIRQRTGRAARIGQRAPHVLELRRLPPAPISEALGIIRVLRGKARRARQWVQTLDRSVVEPPREDHRSFEAVVIVTLQSGARQGSVALGRQRGSTEWQMVDHAMIEALRDRGALIESGYPERPSTEILAAVRRCTSPLFVSRPELVQRLMTAAADAAARRRVDRVVALDTLVRCASRSHGLGLEQRLATATVDQLLADVAPFETAAPDPCLRCLHLIPAMSARD